MSTRDSIAAATFASSERTDDVHRFTRLWSALVVLGTGLFVQQFETLAKIKRVVLSRAPGDPVNDLGQKAGRLVLESWRVFTTPTDVAIAAVIVGAAGYVVWSEVKHGTVTALLQRAAGSNRLLAAFLMLVALIVTRSYLTPGQVFMGDAETHMLRSWMFAEHLRHLETPTWSNAWYGGFPLLANYGCLYFIATALVTLLLGDIHVATKLLLWTGHIVSVFAMFWFLREVTRQRLPALVGAVAYALSFHRLHILLYQGDLQLSIIFALYPLLLLLAERYIRIRTNARLTFVLVTAVHAALILNHHGYAFFGLVLFAIYLAARLAVTPAPLWERFKILALFGCAEVASLMVTAFLWAPFLFAMEEFRGQGSAGQGNSAFAILLPNPASPILLLKLFRWSAVSDGTSVGYVGLSIGILAVIGAVYGVKRRLPVVVGLAVTAVTALAMVRNNVPYNIKNIDFFMMFVCALAAWAVIAISEQVTRFAAIERSRMRWGRAFPARVTTVCIALIVVDLGPTTFQSVFRENYEFKQPMYQQLLARDAGYKVIERQVLVYDPDKPPDAFFDSNKLGIPSAYAATQTPLGFFHEGAGRSFGYHAEIVKQMHRDLNQGRLSELSATGLYLLGVKDIIFRDRYQWFTPRLEPSPLYSVADDTLRLSYASPLLFAPKVIGIADVAGYPASDLIRERRYLEPETFDHSGRYYRELVVPLMASMKIDLPRGVADTLITRDNDLREDIQASEALRPEILDASTDLKRVTVRYRSNLDAFGQLPYNYFPYLQVEVDGRPAPFYRSAMNHILLRVPAGEHVVTVRGVIPPLQAQLLWASLAASLLVILLPRRLFSSVARPV